MPDRNGRLLASIYLNSLLAACLAGWLAGWLAVRHSIAPGRHICETISPSTASMEVLCEFKVHMMLPSVWAR